MAILYGSGTSPAAAVQGDLRLASDGKRWDKPGLTSSFAKANGSTRALGMGEASTLGLTTFDGLALSGNAVLVKPTLLGDADLSGTVDLTDYTTVVRNFGVTGANWTSGNFDYTGTVSLADYTSVVLNFGSPAYTAPPVANGATKVTRSAQPAVAKLVHARKHHASSHSSGV